MASLPARILRICFKTSRPAPFWWVVNRLWPPDVFVTVQVMGGGWGQVRVSESRFGYSLSHVIKTGTRIKHYMIDQTPNGQYQVGARAAAVYPPTALPALHAGRCCR
jgi:hypothetical protein